MPLHRPNRTFISSVLFLDIVGYSKQPVTEQIRLKEQFNTLAAHLISDIPENDRIVLDTGDGAALSFLGDPEDALFVAVKLRDAITEKQEAEFPDLHLRMGINLGPVKLLKDINGRPNLIGDGINVAQRVMNFAEPDQILVSRSFYDVVSCLSDEYRNLFSRQATQTDKHVREHELYEIGFVDPDNSVTISQRMEVLEKRTRIPPEQLAVLEAALEPHLGEDHAHVLVQTKSLHVSDFGVLRDALALHIPDPGAREAFKRIKPAGPARARTAGGSRRWMPLAVVAAVVAAALGGWFLSRWAAAPGADAGVAKVPEAGAKSARAPEAAAAPVPVPRAGLVTPAPTAATPAPAKAPAPGRLDAKVAKGESKSSKDAVKESRSASPAPPASPGASGAPSAPASRPRNAILRFQIVGYAELFVDGTRVGQSGSIQQYAVTAGEHRIEIRGCGFPPDTKYQSVSVEANNTKLVVASC